ncbi:MAG: hypothetical protein OR993_03585, partial [Candidatus Poseidoniales archaeon]|nr:hypothetical protein [Candidatus Poseidoniales archaeon]
PGLTSAAEFCSSDMQIVGIDGLHPITPAGLPTSQIRYRPPNPARLQVLALWVQYLGVSNSSLWTCMSRCGSRRERNSGPAFPEVLLVCST